MINQSIYWLKSVFTQSEFLIKDEVALGVYEELRLVYPELGVKKQTLIRSTGIENYMKILKETTTRGARVLVRAKTTNETDEKLFRLVAAEQILKIPRNNFAFSFTRCLFEDDINADFVLEKTVAPAVLAQRRVFIKWKIDVRQ